MYNLFKKRLKDSNVLITGGLGFMGSNLAHDLVKLNANVIIYDALLEPYGGIRANIEEIEDKVKVIIGDIRDLNKLKNVIKDVNYVFHYAAQVSHGESMKHPFLDMEINCVGTLNLLEALRLVNDDAKVVYAGTRGQYGPALYTPIDEFHSEFSSSVYGIDKSAAEKYCLIYGKAYGMNVTSLRFTNCYGPRHQMSHSKYGVFNWFIRKALFNEVIEVWNGQQSRDYLYVGDANRAALLAAVKKEADGEVFIVATGKSVKLLYAVKLIIDIVGSGSYRVVSYPPGEKLFEPGKIRFAIDKAREKLCWSPLVDVRDGIRRTVEFYQERLPQYL